MCSAGLQNLEHGEIQKNCLFIRYNDLVCIICMSDLDDSETCKNRIYFFGNVFIVRDFVYGV